MTDHSTEPLHLRQLVLVIAMLAMAGSILAGAHYLAIDLPHRQQVSAPENYWGEGLFQPGCTNMCGEPFPSQTHCYSTCIRLGIPHDDCEYKCTITSSYFTRPEGE